MVGGIMFVINFNGFIVNEGGEVLDQGNIIGCQCFVVGGMDMFNIGLVIGNEVVLIECV